MLNEDGKFRGRVRAGARTKANNRSRDEIQLELDSFHPSSLHKQAPSISLTASGLGLCCYRQEAGNSL